MCVISVWPENRVKKIIRLRLQPPKKITEDLLRCFRQRNKHKNMQYFIVLISCPFLKVVNNPILLRSLAGKKQKKQSLLGSECLDSLR